VTILRRTHSWKKRRSIDVARVVLHKNCHTYHFGMNCSH